jgi:hypothetical protein
MKGQKKFFNNDNGITLIALVISIILLLILAGVSISATVGDNGVVTKAQQAKLAQEDAAWDENAQMILSAAYMNKDEIENLTAEQQATAGNDESKISAYKKTNMASYLKEQFLAYDDTQEVIVTQLGEGYIIISGDRTITVDSNFGMETSTNNKYLVAKTGEWLFTVENGTAKLTAYTQGLSGTIQIPYAVVDRDSDPDNPQAYVVTAIGNDVFNYATRVTNVDFSLVNNTLTSIGARAFAFCSNLEINIPEDLPNTLTSIGDKAFYGCSKLSGNINEIMSSGMTLGKGVFMKCSNLTGDIQSIFDQNFYLDESGNPIATIIEESQFSGYSGLTGSLVIPKYITSIGNNAFYGCSGITNVSFETGSQCTSIGDYAFAQTKGLASAITIPNSVTSMGTYCFSESGITGITLSNNLATLGTYSFYLCSELTGAVNFPSTLATISTYVFGGTKITSINFEMKTEGSNKSGVTSISSNAFENCYSLTTITSSDTTSFPSTLVSIGTSAFRNDSKITTISLPNSLKTIGSSAFWSNSRLNITSWSTELTSISDSAFVSCTTLTSFPKNSTKLTTIGGSAFQSCTQLGKDEGSFNIITWIPTTKITSIGAQAFYGDTYITGEYTGSLTNSNSRAISVSGSAFSKTSVTYAKTFNTSATTIAASEYAGITSLSNITNGNLVIPEGVTSIGSQAFRGCSAIRTVTLPSTLTSLGTYVFAECKNLTTVTFASGYSLTNIPDGTFYRSTITSITLPSSTKTLSTSCFNGSSIQNITMPSSVTSIGSSAFAWSSLKSITLNSGLLSIGGSAFAGTQLTAIDIPDTVTSIGTSVVHRCPKLKSITFGKGITSIPDSFANYPLSGDGATGIGVLETITIKGKITSIGNNAFMKQPNLKTITFSGDGSWSDITRIGTKAFYNCSLFTGSVILNSSCTIYEDSFENCPLEIVKE